jgi:hypothetical protein
MIHDVTIPFSFDTSPIEAQIANIGESEVMKLIREVTMKGIYSVMPKKNGWYRDNTPKNDDEVDWKGYIDSHVYKWLDANTQTIIDEAALLMAMRGSRKKAWREVLEELKAERDAE